MNLHNDKSIFKDAITITAQQMNIQEIYVEKDYWVTYALHAIFKDAIGADAVFKGGTSLSKCYKLIDRFSEDIDLVILRREGETNNKLTNKIKKISKVVSDVLPEIEIAGVTRKMGMNRKTAHTYKKEFQGNYGQIRDAIIIEASWLGNFEPCTTEKISTYIYDIMQKNGQQKLAEEYELLPFDVLVLDPKRTLCEKIMSLVRFSYTAERVEDLKKKIRHTYDLNQLLKKPELSEFFSSEEFDKMLLKVGRDDVISYKNSNEWLRHHPGKAKIFDELETVWDELKATYNGAFKNLVFGNFPNESEVLETLRIIKERLKTIEWDIKTGDEE
jgi:hypothetical protein